MTREDWLKLFGAILGPIAGFIATYIKTRLQKRLGKRDWQLSFEEVNHLLECRETLDRVAKLDSPPSQLEQVRAVVHGGIERALSQFLEAYTLVPAAVGSVGIAASVQSARGAFSRIFLLYRPTRWWLWLLHACFYLLMGTTFFGLIGLFSSQEDDWVGGLVGFGIIVAVAAGLNLIANSIDKKNHVRSPAARLLCREVTLAGGR